MQIEKILRQYQLDKTLVDIVRFSDVEYTITGYVQQVSKNLVSIIKIDDDGTFDGQIILESETIARLRHESRVLKCITSLMKKQKYREFADVDLSSMKKAMASLNHHFGYINCHTNDEETCFIGELIKIGEYFQLHEYGTIERLERSLIWLRTEDVTMIEAGANYEENLKHIYSKALP